MNDEIQKMFEIITKNQSILYNQNKELFYANVFHDTIKGSEWLPSDFALSPGNMALGYPAFYVLYRVLDEFKPKNILEIGLGQSTKMIALYNRYSNSCQHQVIEHDREWINFFNNHFELPPSTKITELPIKDITIDVDEVSANVTAYMGFSDLLCNSRFDFICIDGPYGFRSPQYARIDIMGILPDCLEDSFVIFLDDCERNGELNTFNLISSTLTEVGIKVTSNIYTGIKGTGIIVSENLAFLCSM